MRPLSRAGLATLVCILPLCLACGGIENAEELQTLAGEIPHDQPATTPSSGTATASSADAGSSLDNFPLVGSVFPGLDGRLHSSLCDPASDPFSTCL